eukprot:991744-Pelagomonas_calceolata.AAC.3
MFWILHLLSLTLGNADCRIANVKREIVNAKLDYSRMLTKVTFVGIYGGKEGAASERRELAKLGKIFDSRQEITDINDVFIKSVACCLSCASAAYIAYTAYMEHLPQVDPNLQELAFALLCRDEGCLLPGLEHRHQHVPSLLWSPPALHPNQADPAADGVSFTI